MMKIRIEETSAYLILGDLLSRISEGRMTLADARILLAEEMEKYADDKVQEWINRLQ